LTRSDSPAPATVRVAQGLLRGQRRGDAAVFLGVPFAEPPVGPLRWRPPQPAAGWQGGRDALAFGPDFPQPGGIALRGNGQDEDALHLSIWTPTLDANARLPVLVWLYGGGFFEGSSSDPGTDGARLAAEGAVVVAINYRIGLFGFLAHPALSAESPQQACGNYGLLDQVAALAWVRDNIAGFGGDPDRVTAFGVSAGSASIALLLTAPAARGLFHRAILQSPGAGRPLATLAQAEQAGRALGEDLATLRALPARELLARTSRLSPKVRRLTMPRVLRPIHDGWLLPHDERPALQAGAFQAMPLLVGTNADEGTMLTRPWAIAKLDAWREQVTLNFAGAQDEAAALWPARTDGEARQAVAAMFADTQFNYGARLLAQSMAAREPRTWRYLFLRRRPGEPDGPHHTDEVPYVFGTLPQGAGEADQALSAAMRKAWVAFAASGDPNGAGLPQWPAYAQRQDKHLAFGDTITAGAGWRTPQLDFLERFYG
jgi:carboxylesterase type B